MSTLTSILGTDTVSSSRGVINNNFANLNASKVETSVLTSSYLSASSIAATYTPSSVLSIIARPPGAVGTVASVATVNTNAFIGLINLQNAIQFNKITYAVTSVTTAGQYRVGFYTENGQTQIASVTTQTITALGQFSDNVSSVLLSAGNYYTAVVPVSSVNTKINFYDISSASNFASVIGKPYWSGTASVAASTLPTSFTPSAISGTTSSGIIMRLDQ